MPAAQRRHGAGTGRIVGSMDPATPYRWTVQACNALTCGPPSPEVIQIPNGFGGLQAPSNVVTKSNDRGCVLLSWADNATGESRFDVTANGGPGSGVVGNVGANATASLVCSLDPFYAYSFYVQACSAAGCGPRSPTVVQKPSGWDGLPTNVAIQIQGPVGSAVYQIEGDSAVDGRRIGCRQESNFGGPTGVCELTYRVGSTLKFQASGPRQLDIWRAVNDVPCRILDSSQQTCVVVVERGFTLRAEFR
jgi:hypothetical protein